MNVTALVESADHVCCRYRVAAFQSALAAAGITLTMVPLLRATAARLDVPRIHRILRSASDADAVVLQRRLLAPVELALLRMSAKRIIFDFDDSIWLRDSYSAKGFKTVTKSRRFRATVKTCDLMFAGNEYLAAKVRRYIPADRVVVVPTCVDPAAYPLASHEPTDAVRLVWVGSSSTLRGLERFRDVLEAIGREVPNLRLKLICNRFMELTHLPVEPVVWREETEAAEIATADIGIGWVPDDPWSRGKCGLKLLQYQAAGLPVIANPVGVQSRMVRDGVNGYQATTPDEWVAAVRRLAADAKLRRTLGAAGRRQVETEYSVQVGTELWVRSLLSHPEAGA